MIESGERERVKSALPLFQHMDADLTDQFMREAILARIPAGRDVMAEGEGVDAVPVVLSGSIRVYRVGESGREITLYRFGRGECCVLSANSILGSRLFPANAQVEDEVEVAFVPAAVFDAWLSGSRAWRAFVFDAMSKRLVSLLDTVDDVAFGRMDVRVAELLFKRSGGRRGTFNTTHQAIADDLGSSREVISRILEDFQARGQIRLSRGVVEVLDPALLEGSALL